MPPFREVPTLKLLCLDSVGKLVISFAPCIIAKINLKTEPYDCVVYLKKSLIQLQHLLTSHIPDSLYDDVAVKVLQAIKGLIDTTKKTFNHVAPVSVFVAEMNVIVSLTEVVLNKKLKQIEFSVWPKIMRYVLYKNLAKLRGLEILNLGSCSGSWRTDVHDKYILDGISHMNNLKSLCLCFDCTDTMIQILGEKCPHLHSLDITSSRSVTDRSVPSLLKCQQLRELQLHRTSVTTAGFGQLVVGLPKLHDLGRCDDFGNVIKYVHLAFPNAGPFPLKKLQTRGLTTESLRYFVALCPNVEHVCLFHDELVSDFMVLTTLDNLRELKLSCCGFYCNYIKQLLEVRGSSLTSLHLEHVDEIDLNAIMCISQCCPLLKNLVLYNCDFVDQQLDSYPSLEIKPFQHLERIFWVVDCAVHHLEFLLSHSVNIRFIHLGSSTGITHETVKNILAVNPMRDLEELRILYSSDMSLYTVKMLMKSCSKLKVLSELEGWQGITMEELIVFRLFVSNTNLDLDISPTLSN